MGILDQLAGLLGGATGGGADASASGGNVSESDIHDHYRQLTNEVPAHQIGDAVGPALSNLGTSQVLQQILNSAQQMDPQQRGGLMQSLLNGLSSGGMGGNLSGLLSQLGVRPEVAQNPSAATPEEVAQVAAHAHENAPGVFQAAMGFYRQHPTLVQALGTVAMTQIMRHLVQQRGT
ncbi:MAG: hypothetical protein JO295_00940 [Verrucomicrobia bacterium]|nr:hypothetical protein [Verrucomicrobiota bacterium]